jgi:hypothetical protein
MKPSNPVSLTDDERSTWFAKLSAAKRRELTRQAMEDLEYRGLIRDSGLRRNGRMVYVVVKLQ